MSVNMRYGIDPKKTEKFGKVFHTIDFEMNEKFRGSDYIDKSKRVPCGEFLIDGKRTKVTIPELERIMETAHNSLENLRKAYKLGSMPL